MALAEPVKKGGRYTKKEQEERKIEVYHLHFEENKPATKIAELLNVNRNTINDDIHYWHQQLANEFKAQDLTAKMTKQIQRMEIQRDRLLDDLEEAENLDEKMTEQEAIELAKKAVKSATLRDSFSGDGIDVLVINKKGTKEFSEKLN